MAFQRTPEAGSRTYVGMTAPGGSQLVSVFYRLFGCCLHGEDAIEAQGSKQGSRILLLTKEASVIYQTNPFGSRHTLNI